MSCKVSPEETREYFEKHPEIVEKIHEFFEDLKAKQVSKKLNENIHKKDVYQSMREKDVLRWWNNGL